jgi:hypothetical protein
MGGFPTILGYWNVRTGWLISVVWLLFIFPVYETLRGAKQWNCPLDEWKTPPATEEFFFAGDI